MANVAFGFQEAVFTLESMVANIERQAQTIEKLINENKQLRQENQQWKARIAELEARTKKTVRIVIFRRPLTGLGRNLLLAHRRRNGREDSQGTKERRFDHHRILTIESFTV